MKYPIMINLEDLANAGIDITSDDVKNNRILMIVHHIFYEVFVLKDHRNWRLKVIKSYLEELEDPVKDILLNIAISIDQSGDFNSLYNAITIDTSGTASVLNVQEAMSVMIPPSEWNAIMSLEPDILFSGGEI